MRKGDCMEIFETILFFLFVVMGLISAIVLFLQNIVGCFRTSGEDDDSALQIAIRVVCLILLVLSIAMALWIWSWGDLPF